MSTTPKAAEQPSLRYHLHKALNSNKPGRDLSVVHASDMTKPGGFCPRKRLIQRLLDMKPPNEHISASQQMLFDLGNAVEQIVIARAAEVGVAVADWKCLRCKDVYQLQPKPKVCGRCGDGDCLAHAQRRLYTPKSGISCGIDMLAAKIGPKLMITEVKSMVSDQFKKLAGPLSEHRLRTALYMRIAEESNDPIASMIDTEEAIVLYVDKGGHGPAAPDVTDWKLGDNGFSPFKEYRIGRMDDETTPILELGRAYLEARQTQTICAGICIGPDAPEAKNCPVASRCFSSSFPVGSKF